MKIPFDIKYRPQIESGEYKVVTRDGHHVRIICWDRKSAGDGQPIVALVENGHYENSIWAEENGVYKGTMGHEYDLFITTPEPELAESEDEIIRNNIIASVEMNGGLTQAQKSEIYAYLEKQKDASKAIEAVDRIDKYIDENLANAHDMKGSNPDKKYYRGWDDALGKMSGILQDVYSDEKQKEPTFISDLPPDDKGEPGENGILEKQKEQKPVEWSEEDEGLIDLAVAAVEDFYDKRNPIRAEIINFLKSCRPQLKQEWSEEEKQKLNRIYEIIGWAMDEHAFSFCKKLIGDKEGVELQDFLRSIAKPKAEWNDTDNIGWDEAFACVTRAEKAAKNEEELQNAVTAEKWLKEIKFKYCVHPVKQEWSEEDKDRVVQYLRDLDGGMLWSKATEITSDILDILRPLRPSWKPSEDEERLINTSISFLKDFADKGYENAVECIDWLKSKLNGNSGK